MTAVAELTIEQRVADGAAWLDRHRPGWVDRIDLDRLNVRSHCNCILGQEYGHFDRSPMLSYSDAYGFDISDAVADDDDESEAEFAALTDAWRDLIERRRAEAGAA